LRDKTFCRFITKGNRSTDRDFEEFLDHIRNSGETNTGDLLESPINGGSSESPGAHRCENRWWLDGNDGTPRGIVPNFVIPPSSGVQFCDPSDTITIGERGRVDDRWVQRTNRGLGDPGIFALDFDVFVVFIDPDSSP
jgi:hypothetical protein